jgi:hypothetical protein
MAGTPKLRIRKYFGSSSLQEMVFSLDEAKEFLAYFFTKDGGQNILVAAEGQFVKNFDELATIANQPKYQNNDFVEVGLYLATSQGRTHIST